MITYTPRRIYAGETTSADKTKFTRTIEGIGNEELVDKRVKPSSMMHMPVIEQIADLHSPESSPYTQTSKAVVRVSECGLRL